MLNIGKFSLCADAEKGTRFSLIHETTRKEKKKEEKIYATTVFKPLDIRQQRLVIPEHWKQRSEPYSHPSLLTLESFQAMTLGKEK